MSRVLPVAGGRRGLAEGKFFLGEWRQCAPQPETTSPSSASSRAVNGSSVWPQGTPQRGPPDPRNTGDEKTTQGVFDTVKACCRWARCTHRRRSTCCSMAGQLRIQALPISRAGARPRLDRGRERTIRTVSALLQTGLPKAAKVTLYRTHSHGKRLEAQPDAGRRQGRPWR